MSKGALLPSASNLRNKSFLSWSGLKKNEAQSKPKSKHFSKVIIQYDPCIYENRKQGMKSIVFASFGFSMRTLKEFFFPEKDSQKKNKSEEISQEKEILRKVCITKPLA